MTMVAETAGNVVKIGPAKYFRVEHGMEIPSNVPDDTMVVAWNSLDEVMEWDFEVQLTGDDRFLRATARNMNLCRRDCTTPGDVVKIVG